MISDDRISKIIKQKGGVLNVRSDSTVTEAAEIMRDCNVGCVIVEDKDGRIEGILTERDIIAKVVAISGDPDDQIVGRIMTTSVLTCTMETTVKEAQQIMSTHRVRHLPVVDDEGLPVGVISIRDIVSQQLTNAEEVIRVQGAAITDLEHQHPGISEIRMDRAGRVVI